MSLTQASAQLQDNKKQLLSQWALLKSQWNDENASRFETEIIEALTRETDRANKAMKQMSTVLQRMKRDCQ